MPSISLLHGDCLDLMPTIEAGSVDLTVTSPPYDNLRSYNDMPPFDESVWKPIIEGIYRLTKDGGVVVWVVADATIKGSETGTSFKQALFAKDCGFRLHDTMIWTKNQMAFPDVSRYYNAFEYMFVFSKGKPNSVNLIRDKHNASAGRIVNGRQRERDGTTKPMSGNGARSVREFGVRWNHWQVYNQKRGTENQHPAIFPEKLAADHIQSWSNEGDTVFDPFLGSGTTGKMAFLANRNFIGIERDDKYFAIAQQRIAEAQMQPRLIA